MLLITIAAMPDDEETRGEDKCRKYVQVCTLYKSQWTANEEKPGEGKCPPV